MHVHSVDSRSFCSGELGRCVPPPSATVTRRRGRSAALRCSPVDVDVVVVAGGGGDGGACCQKQQSHSSGGASPSR